MKENGAMLFKAQIKKVLDDTNNTGKKPELLLHACCAPCSTAVLEQLTPFFRITILYYNPNIYPQTEHNRRRNELLKFVSLLRCPEDERPEVKTIPYKPKEFDAIARGLENEQERGNRCFACYKLRLEKTADFAVSCGFQYFTTVLSISPHKDSKKINEIGKKLEEQKNDAVKFLYADFKKNDGYKRSLEISGQYGLYRQDYCGCKFSMRKLNFSPDKIKT